MYSNEIAALDNLKERIYNMIEDHVGPTIHENGPEHKTLKIVIDLIDEEIADYKFDSLEK